MRTSRVDVGAAQTRDPCLIATPGAVDVTPGAPGPGGSGGLGMTVAPAGPPGTSGSIVPF
jgi:hypothetical protein